MTTTESNEYTWLSEVGKTKAEALPPGPWQDEPDKVVWVDSATELDCMIVRGPAASLCGYVAVPPDHPAYKAEYHDVDIYAHGGLTYSDECGGVICHVPAEGRPADVWWFGFDCAHYNDYIPGFAHLGAAFEQMPHERYKTVKYVKRECESLAHQLKEMEEAGG